MRVLNDQTNSTPSLKSSSDKAHHSSYEKMSDNSFIQFVKIDHHSSTPKYQQVVDGFMKAIESGRQIAGEILPSINELSILLNVSRDTIERAYRHLKQMGIIQSVPRRGFFVKSIQAHPLKVLLLFNKFSDERKLLFEALGTELRGSNVFEIRSFESERALSGNLSENKSSDFTHFVLMIPWLDSEKVLKSQSP
jgi:DNA-binding transcriptional regulator YhcF (GntR family)